MSSVNTSTTHPGHQLDAGERRGANLSILKKSTPRFILLKQFDQIHKYGRSVFQIAVTWFTFWVTMNTAGIGWFAGRDPNQANHTQAVFTASMFILTGLCAEVALGFYFAWTRRANERSAVILRELGNELAQTGQDGANSGMPELLIQASIVLMGVVYLILLACWVALPLVI